MIKLIATDLDGTLFYPKRRVKGLCSSNREFLKKYLNDGGKLVLVTGRSAIIQPRVEKTLGHKVAILGCNGAFFKEDDEMKISYPMDKELLLDLYSYCRIEFDFFNFMLFNETENTFVSGGERLTPFLVKVAKVVNGTNGFYKENLIPGEKIFLDAINNYDSFKLMPVVGFEKKSHIKAEAIKLAIKTRYANKFNVVASAGAIEITAPEADKGATLLKYCKMNNIKEDEVFVCGDSGNDLPMFEYFPHSFCMSHSPTHIKSQANHVIDRISDLKKYLNDENSYKNDILHQIDYDKALKKL